MHTNSPFTEETFPKTVHAQYYSTLLGGKWSHQSAPLKKIAKIYFVFCMTKRFLTSPQIENFGPQFFWKTFSADRNSR